MDSLSFDDVPFERDEPTVAPDKVDYADVSSPAGAVPQPRATRSEAISFDDVPFDNDESSRFDDVEGSDPMGDASAIGVALPTAARAVKGIREWGVLTSEEGEAEKKDRIERARQQKLWADQQRADIESRMGKDFIPGQTFQEEAAAKSEEVAKGPAPTLSAGRSAAEGFLRETGRGVVSLAVAPGITVDFVDWAATGDTNESGYTKAVRGYSDAISKTFPGDPTRRDELIDQLAAGGGSLTSMIAGGAALKVAGVSGKVAQYYSGIAQGGVGGYEDAEANNATPGQKYASFFLNAGLGATEAIPISRAFDRLNDVSGGKVQEILANSAANSLEEFIQELGQGLGQNFIANTLAGYDLDRSTTEGVANQAAVGFVLGGIMGGGSTLVSQNIRTEQVDDKGASSEQKAAIQSNDVKSTTADIDPALAQAAVGQPVESPGERAKRVARERMAAQAQTAQPVTPAAPTAGAQDATSEVIPESQPAEAPPAVAGTEPPVAGVAPAAPTSPTTTEPAAPNVTPKRKVSDLLKPHPGEGYRIGSLSFEFNERNGGRYLRVRDRSGKNLLQGSDEGAPGVDVTDIWSAADPNQYEPRQGNKVGINSLGNNVPTQFEPVFRDWLEGKIDEQEAIARVGNVEVGGGQAATEAPAAEAPAAPVKDDTYDKAVAAVRRYNNTSPRFLAARLGIGEKRANKLLFQLEDSGVLQFKKGKFTVVPDAATAESNPDTNVVPETDATIVEQQKALIQGTRRAVFYPDGTKPAAPVEGTKRIKVQGTGIFDYNPGKVTPKEIRDAAKAGRLNELLDLGPVNKEEVAASAAAGSQPIGVVERTPQGTEVKAAAGTMETAPAQVQALEATKASPANSVAVEDPRKVIAERQAAPRVLQDQSDESQYARELQAEQNEIVADQIKPFLKGRGKAKTLKGVGEKTGKNWMKVEREARSKLEFEGAKIAEQFAPIEAEGGFLDPDVTTRKNARSVISARAEAIVDAANSAGVKIPEKVGTSTDASMNLGQGGMSLVVARDLLKALKNPYKDIEEHYMDFVSRDMRLRKGLVDEVISERRAESDDNMREAQGGNIEQLAANPIGDTSAEADTELSAETPDVANPKIVGNDDIEFRKPTSAKLAPALDDGTEKAELKLKNKDGTLRTEVVDKAKPASEAKTLSKEEKAAWAKANGYLMRESVGGAEAVKPLDEADILQEVTFSEALERSGEAKGNDLNQTIVNGILARIHRKVGETPIKVVAQETLDQMFPDRKPGKVDGYYDPNKGHIVMSANFLKGGEFDAQILAHEGVHAYLQRAIDSDATLRKDIQDILDYAKSQSKNKSLYGFTDVHEFIAEALSNSSFQNYLARTKLPPALAARFAMPSGSLWQGFVAAVRRHMGFGRNDVDALSMVMQLSERAAKIADKNPDGEIIRSLRQMGMLSEGQQEDVTPIGTFGGSITPSLSESGKRQKKYAPRPAGEVLRDQYAAMERQIKEDQDYIDRVNTMADQEYAEAKTANPRRAAVLKAKARSHRMMAVQLTRSLDKARAALEAKARQIAMVDATTADGTQVYMSEGRQKSYIKQLTDAGVPEDIATELDDVLTNELGDMDADTLAFVLDDLKTQYGATSESKAPSAEQVDKKVQGQADALNKSAKDILRAAEAQDDYIPGKNPGRRRLLGVMTNMQIAQAADDFFGRYSNPVRAVAKLVERRRVRKQELVEELAPAVEKLVAARDAYMSGKAEIRKNNNLLSASKAKQKAIWQDFANLMNDATMAEVHPDKPLTDDANKHLGKNALSTKWSKAQHAELSQRWEALPDDLKALWSDTLAHYTNAQNTMNYGRLKNILTLSGHTDKGLLDRFFNDKASEADKALVGPRLAEMIEDGVELSRIKGPYFPLARRGDWRVQGIYKIDAPKDARKLSDSEFEFADKDEAIAFVEGQKLKTVLKSVYVDKNTGDTYVTDKDGKEVKVSKNDVDAEQRFRVVVQNRHVEFASSESEANQIASQLRSDGLQVDDVMQRTNNVPQAPNADQLSEQMKQLAATLDGRKGFRDLSEAQRNELKEVLGEVSLRFLSSTRIQSRFIRRRGIEGASTDVVRNAYDYADAASGYLAKLEVQPEMDAAMKDMDKRLASLAGQGTGAGTGASELVKELRSRVLANNFEEGNGKVDAGVRRLTQLAFLRFLASPAYSIFNMMQPHLVALPSMAAEYGEARAAIQFSKAYLDVSGIKVLAHGALDTVRAIGGNQGRHFINELKGRLKDANEKAMLDELVKIGFIDVDAGMMVARNLKRPETVMGQYYDPVMGYMDNIARQAPKAVETLNRAVVALSTYRLAMAEHGKHQNAIQDAMDMVDNTQGTYSQSNQAPIFRSKFGRVALQFKKYGQMMYHLLGRQVGRAIRNQNPGDRKKAVKSLAYTLAAHQLAAGTMGLPWEPAKILLMAFNGLGLVDYDWDDFKKDVEEFYTWLTGSPSAAEMLTKGVSRAGGYGFDMSSRVGLDSLMTFGAPRSFKETDFKSFLFDTVGGASSSMATMWLKAINAAADGDYSKIVNALPFKFAVDVGQAVKKGAQGDYTVPEAIMKGVGVTPASQAREQERRNAERKQADDIKERYNYLKYGYINAGNDLAKVAKFKSKIREWNAAQDKLPKAQRGQKIKIETVEMRRRQELRKKDQ